MLSINTSWKIYFIDTFSMNKSFYRYIFYRKFRLSIKSTEVHGIDKFVSSYIDVMDKISIEDLFNLKYFYLKFNRKIFYRKLMVPIIFYW